MEHPHPRLVRLLGYCNERDIFCIVYEFMKGGSLQSLLENPEKMKKLNSKQRIQIALDIGNIVFLTQLHYIFQHAASNSFIPMAFFILTSNQTTFCLMKTIEL